MRTTRGSSLVLLLAMGFVYLGYVLYPLLMTVAESLRADSGLTLDVYMSLFNPAHMDALLNSVSVSILSVFCSGVLGLTFAVVFTQCDFPLRGLLGKLVIIPLALPPLVGVIAFLFVFGESGILPRLLQNLFALEKPPLALDGIPAIVAVHTYSFNVYFYLLASAALRQLDSSVLEAAESFGSSSIRTFRRIVLPELRPALLAASILTFMTSMASFSAPLLFAGEKRFLTLQIYNAKLNGEMDVAAAVSVFLALVSIIVFIIMKRLGDEMPSTRATKGAVRVGTLRLSKGVQRALGLVTVFVLFVEMLPIIAIGLISFAEEGSWTWQILPASYTAENYLRLWQDSNVLQPVANSVLMSLLTMLGAIIFGVALAYIITKGHLRRWHVQADLLATLPYAIPGTVIAISLILAFNKPTVFTAQTVLVGTFIILPLAYWMKMYPLVVRSTSASLAQVDDALLEAAESFGAGTVQRFTRVILPLIRPGIVSGAVLVMITALGEFVSSILLYTYANRPISVEILAQMRMYNFGTAAAYSVFLLVIVLGVVLFSQSLSDIRRTGARL